MGGVRVAARAQGGKRWGGVGVAACTQWWVRLGGHIRASYIFTGRVADSGGEVGVGSKVVRGEEFFLG